MSRIGKSIKTESSDCLGQQRWEKWEVILMGMGFLFWWGVENVLKLIVVITVQPYEYTKLVSCMGCELYHNKAVTEKEKEKRTIDFLFVVKFPVANVQPDKYWAPNKYLLNLKYVCCGGEVSLTVAHR